MKIEEVKRLDDGVSGITIEGRIIKTPKEPRDSEYGWSQMIVLKDDTGEISSWINIENAENAYEIGQYIKIKGKVSKYMKGNKPGISLNNGNVIDEIQKDEEVSQEKPEVNVTTTVNNKNMDKVWENKDLRIARESALKNITEYVVAGLVKLGNRFDYANEDVDFIYNGLGKITSEAITKELGGTVVEVKEDPKVVRIETARELVRNPHLAEPINNIMATIPQKKQIFGYINEEGKKVKGIKDSQYITKEEKEGIGDWQKLTKARAFKMYEKWYGTKETMGERDKRELAEKEDNPLIEESKPIVKKDIDDTSSLVKDLLVEAIYKQRKELHLEDGKKFKKEIGYNPKLEELTEEKLLKLKELLRDWRPDWVKE